MIAKGQTSVFNIVGAAASASGIVFLRFPKIVDTVSRNTKQGLPKITKSLPTLTTTVHLKRPSLNSLPVKKRRSPTTFMPKIRIPSLYLHDEAPQQQTTTVETQTPVIKAQATTIENQTPTFEPSNQQAQGIQQKPAEIEIARPAQPTQIPKTTQQAPPKSNGCPKNLEYFKLKPRPKTTPDECFTCKNLITCVCLTSN